MPKAIKEGWDDLDDSVKEAIEAHERKNGSKFSELGNKLQKAEPVYNKMQELVNQYPVLADKTPEDLANGAAELAAVQHALENDPLNTVMQIANIYGVGGQLQQIFSGKEPTKDQSTVLQLQSEIASLKNQIKNQQGAQNIDSAVDQRLNMRDAQQVLNNFMSTNEYYGDVEHLMPQFIEIVKSQNPHATIEETLSSAYDMAIHASPEIRAKLLATGGKKSTANAALEDNPAAKQINSKRRTKAIKAAKIGSVKSQGSGETPAKTEDELMGEAFDRLMNS